MHILSIICCAIAECYLVLLQPDRQNFKAVSLKQRRFFNIPNYSNVPFMWPQLQVLLSKLHSNLQSTGKTFSARQDKNLAHQTKAYRWGEGRGNNAFFTLYSHCVSQSTSSIKSSPSLNWKSHATEILLNEHQAFTAKALLLLRDAGEAAMVPSRIFMAKGKHLFLSALKQSGFQNKLVKIHRDMLARTTDYTMCMQTVFLSGGNLA